MVGRPYVSTAFAYDPVQRPYVMLHYLPAPTGNVAWALARNPAGQIAGVTRDNDNFAWTGHVNLARPYQANGLNQYTASGTAPDDAAFAYDDNGNLTASTGGAGSDAYAYDVENRLVSVSGAHNATLSYDPLGRLWQVSSGGTTRTFLYDGDALVAEYNGAGTLVRRHVHNVGADVPMITYEGADLSQPRWLYADECLDSDGKPQPRSFSV